MVLRLARPRFAAVLILVLGACRTAPVYDVARHLLDVDPYATEEDVRDQIERAATLHGWRAEPIGERRLRLTKRRGQHAAVVDGVAHDPELCARAFRHAKGQGEQGRLPHPLSSRPGQHGLHLLHRRFGGTS